MTGSDQRQPNPDTVPEGANSGDASRRAIVAGAGIGGLTAALALSRAGWRVALIERADGFGDVGAGIQISPNANHVLNRLGVEEKLGEIVSEVQSVRVFSARTGEMINQVPLGRTISDRHGAPYCVAHRADLHSVLLDACLADPNIQIRLGSTIADSKSDNDGITVEFNTADGLASQRGLALVGADGVRSIVRRRLMRLPSAVFSGKVAYRTTLPADQIPDEFHGNSGLWLGPDAHVVHYPIRQGNEFNIVAIVNEDWEDDDWSATGDKNALLDRFDKWPDRIKELLAIAIRWLKWPLYGMDSGGIWSEGRITVLGDAAHAMLPYLAQGGAMAIEDAWVLAKNLQASEDVPASLLSYEEERRTRVGKVATAAYDNGRLYHLSGISARARDHTMRRMAPERLLSRYDWLYGWKP